MEVKVAALNERGCTSTLASETAPKYGPKGYNGSVKLDSSKVGVWACLIMRDEARNIPSCFSDLIPMVDGFVVCDTGSLDNSMEVARNCCGELPLVLFSANWHNYSHNRNIVLRRMDSVIRSKAERKTGLNLHEPITWEEYRQLCEHRWFALVTDLDNRFHHQDSGRNGTPVLLERSSLVDDGYFIESRRGGSIYRTNNLLRIDPLGIERWSYVRSVHEYSDSLEPWCDMKVGEISGCYIDYGCSGYRSRDVARALKDVIYLLFDDKLEPGDSRTTFYLAQSYNEAGCTEKARHYYKKRAEMKGTWASERYLSYLKLADLVDRASPGGEQEYLNWLYRGYELGLKRFEIAYRICEYYRLHDMHRMAWQIGEPLLNVLEVDSSEFLVDQAVTGWKFWDILGVSAYYAGKKYHCYMLTLRALNCTLLRGGDRERVHSNLELVESGLTLEEKRRAVEQAAGRESGVENGAKVGTIVHGSSKPLYLKLVPGEGAEGIIRALLLESAVEVGQ